MTFTIGWPQGMFLALVVFAIVAAILDHGKPRSPINAYFTLLGVLLEVALLTWGGFFK